MKSATAVVQPSASAVKNVPSPPPAAVAQMVNASIQSSSAMAMRYATTVTPTSAGPTTGPTMGPTTRGTRMLGAPIVPFPLPAPAPVLTLNIAAASGSPGVLADAGAKAQAGELLAARKMLNDALVSGKLDAADEAAARAQMSELNQTIIFSTEKFPADEYGGVYAVRPGDMMRRIAEQYGITWELLCRLNGMSDPRHLRSDSTLKVIQGPFSAVVSKRTFTLDLYLGSTPGSAGSMYVCTFPVGLGREDSTTPTGTWMCEIHRKLKEPTYYSPRGEGVIQSGDPRNPLGHRWIGLTGIDGQAVGQQSYGIHGTIDDDSIGKTASLGCIRMHNADVELVFDLLVEGKSVVVVRD
jgi:LysM repeat protein